ncbi:MAG: hypothetical protein ABIA78_03965 [archaeon]
MKKSGKKFVMASRIRLPLKIKSEEMSLNKLVIIFVIAGFVLISLFLILFVFSWDVEVDACGDGTSYESCSVNKPYFCEGGFLAPRASVCGCPEVLTQKGDSCISKYQTEPKDISLRYILRGEEGKIDLVVYGGLVDYVSGIPQSIQYTNGESPSRRDFKLKHLDEVEQRELLLPLVIEIQNIVEDRGDQVRIAVSIVQNIPFGNSEKITLFHGIETNYSRYAYEVLYDAEGVCGEKAELLAFLLRELGYGVSMFYYQIENHESIGIKCSEKYDTRDTGYCFIETTGPSIITDDKIEYVGVGKLFSEPEVIFISEGDSFGRELYEYGDARDLIKLRNKNSLNYFQISKYDKLKEKYGLVDIYNA